ncbi:nuclear transport factor 2 family protein [Psychroserpens sp. AS72]|uniref:nuclear transport factor 2 family protein n=1 Tax=Psychroserpens sp. AS72 TaxID=3135775 RepID=UPI00317ACA6B
MKQTIYFILLCFGIGLNLNAQTDEYAEVYKTLKANDSLIFDRAFNHCELQHLEFLIPEDFEFYHDKEGVINSKDVFINVMKNGICNPNNTTKSTRELVDGSLEIYLLKNNGELYGAIQNGIHRFFETTNGNKVAGSTAKFSHLWILENNKWYLKRVLSYDHQMK